MSTAGKVIRCQAAVAYELKKPLVIEEIEVAPPKAHEVRVKIYASGICHTDQHALSGGMASINFPVVLGHEGAGIVESVGAGVFKVQPGDHVILLCSPMCMKCKACLHEDSNFCEKNDVGKNVGYLLDKSSRFSMKGKMIYHFMSTSTFTEYTVVDEFAICRIDKAAPMDQVCLIGCGFSTGFGTVLNTAKVKPGSTCVVFGLGGIGMSAVMACKIAGATKIIGVDINPKKFNKAKELGCTECVNPNDCSKPIQEFITEITKGGADYGFECVGDVDVMASMIMSTNYSYGSANVIGVPKFTDRISFDPMWLLTGRTVQGAFLGDYKAALEFPKLVDEVMAGKIHLNALVSHRLPLNEVNKGFDLMRTGDTIRSVLEIAKK